ncbi:MAG: hypothetical protein BWK80_31110 [Desulfobacteraceae bacterium IS3]|jgi:putative addiction module component (TIGR02574 family)|nr:MAG: hypothetical protein BWK80_31110 [Desulfobacteraceae bacterium IS3]HAO21405.1 addiction module protein [Desulfobacteraceae bacterium]
MESIEQLTEKASCLRPTERIQLVEAILCGLDNPDPNIGRIWLAESEARYEAYKRGEIEATDWNEIRSRYEH